MESSGHTRRLRATAGAAAVAVLALGGCASAPHAGAPRTTALAARQVRKPVPCTVSVTKRRPADGTYVGVHVHTAPGAHIEATARYRTVARKMTALANANGRHTFRYWISDATPGYRVNVDIQVSLAGRKGSCTAWFTPRARGSAPVAAPSPSPSPSPSAAPAPPPSSAPAPVSTTPPPAAAAWCTATASVYDASRNWNNVYVNSNQPYRSATASADGYSWSYETNGSGYAEIYLNGPPPGVLITVTVGGATCTTSD
jgi:hypothetical protein